MAVRNVRRNGLTIFSLNFRRKSFSSKLDVELIIRVSRFTTRRGLALLRRDSELDEGYDATDWEIVVSAIMDILDCFYCLGMECVAGVMGVQVLQVFYVVDHGDFYVALQDHVIGLCVLDYCA